MNQDLTVGNPQTVLWKFCLPMFGSIIFQQLYNIADSLVAGKFIGENALAAVGNSYNVTLVFIAFAFGCNIGCSVIVSQYFGAKEYAAMKTAVYTALISSAVLCAVLMFTGFLCCDPLLAQMKTQPEIMADSALYGYLHTGASLPVLLQPRHRHFHRTGRFQDTLLFSCLFFNLQHRSGHSVCKMLSHGNSRCRMGYLFMPRHQLCAVHASAIKKAFCY